jgi:hypothetical protein
MQDPNTESEWERQGLERLLNAIISLDETKAPIDMATETLEHPNNGPFNQQTPIAEQPVEPKVKPSLIAKRLTLELARLPKQTVKATHIKRSDCYRVNWFQNEIDGFMTVSKIVSSKFLKVTIGTDGALVVEDQTNG